MSEYRRRQKFRLKYNPAIERFSKYFCGGTSDQEEDSVNYKTQQNDTTITTEMTGRFTFSDHAVFRKLIDELSAQSSATQVFDLSGIEFIDSAGLGMLLLARDEGEKNRATVILRGAKGQVKRMLEVARFDTLFQMED
ncbi:anti-anti-sigma factor [Thalassospira marina]|uniref:Anti-anti-sigma factor n=1 Tax=Thalassospira marina TaxID=2048283 RepID=A0A2N3L033_9PROT|nr:anti-anti-sigma factor [Thalassospira marina]